MREAKQNEVRELLRYPAHRVVGIIDSPTALQQALAALQRAGIAQEDIKVFSGEEGIRVIDPRGKQHGLLDRLIRVVQSFLSEEGEHMERYDEELRAGHYLVIVAADNRTKDRIAEILKQHGGHFMDYYDELVIEHLVP